MDMELGIGAEEFVVGSCNNNNNDASHIAKGKRTKRLRALSPCAVTAAAAAITSSSSSASMEHGGCDYGSFSSATAATTTYEEEEEDMANCLILLAQGKRGEGEADNKMREKSGSITSNRRISEVATTATATTKVGFYIYECKTCNRTFPSFQALGGHRASHKRPKVTSEEKKSQKSPPRPLPQPQRQLPVLPLIANCEFEEAKKAHVITSPPISIQLGCGGATNNDSNNSRGFHGGNNQPKIHECSICGSEFTSGQALGGHMRRHRTSTTTSAHAVGIETSCDAAAAAAATHVEVKPQNVLGLDLNLPAPEDDHRDSKFQFAATQKSTMLSAAPALVGCHY